MKRVYLVRHGESEANVSGFPGKVDTPLSPHGEIQSETLAKRFENLPVDVIISSTYTRTQQTAFFFNKTLNKPVVYSELFVEWRHPSEADALHRTDPEKQPVVNARWEHMDDPSWQYSDEETLGEHCARAQDALKFLIDRPEEHIVVITHGGFLRTLLAAMMHGEQLTLEKLYPVFNLFSFVANTGITMSTWDSPVTPQKWRLVTWNDHAHLG